jgi:hypothetical protein
MRSVMSDSTLVLILVGVGVVARTPTTNLTQLSDRTAGPQLGPADPGRSKFLSPKRPPVKRKRLSKATRVKINRCHVGPFSFSNFFWGSCMETGTNVRAACGAHSEHCHRLTVAEVLTLGRGGGELGADDTMVLQSTKHG